MIRVDIKPELLRWARERAGLSIPQLEDRFPLLEAWERGEVRPTLKQVESFAKATHASVGYLFLQQPPVEHVPIPDFRTVGNVHVGHPSPDLLEMLYVCQQRQEWYRTYLRSEGEPPLNFVGSVSVTSDVVETAAQMRHALGFDVDERQGMSTWEEALRHFIRQAEDLGILVMVSGVVLNNTHRPLDPDEFRGFALADDRAPLIFVNGKDTKSAQMFTLAHELAHIWLGQSAVSDSGAASFPDNDVEQWCNRIAAELLVPLAALRSAYDPQGELDAEFSRLARRFKVSTVVILRRIYDAGAISRPRFQEVYAREIARLQAVVRNSGGGDFYLTQAARASRRFSRALVASTFEGQTPFTEAFRLLGVKKIETFRQYGREVGVGV